MNAEPRHGIVTSLRGLLRHGLALLRTRVELLAIELEEERARVLGLLAYGAAAFVLIYAGLVFLAIFLTVLLWDEHRLLVLGLATLAFLGSGAIAAALAMKSARAGSRLFSASLAELAKDQSAVEGEP